MTDDDKKIKCQKCNSDGIIRIVKKKLIRCLSCGHSWSEEEKEE